jgi:hypothetical protein
MTGGACPRYPVLGFLLPFGASCHPRHDRSRIGTRRGCHSGPWDLRHEIQATGAQRALAKLVDAYSRRIRPAVLDHTTGFQTRAGTDVGARVDRQKQERSHHNDFGDRENPSPPGTAPDARPSLSTSPPSSPTCSPPGDGARTISPAAAGRLRCASLSCSSPRIMCAHSGVLRGDFRAMAGIPGQTRRVRGVAQPGSAPALGAGGRGFKSPLPDQKRGRARTRPR